MCNTNLHLYYNQNKHLSITAYTIPMRLVRIVRNRVIRDGKGAVKPKDVTYL